MTALLTRRLHIPGFSGHSGAGSNPETAPLRTPRLPRTVAGGPGRQESNQSESAESVTSRITHYAVHVEDQHGLFTPGIKEVPAWAGKP
jgi:hypothetical protein